MPNAAQPATHEADSLTPERVRLVREHLQQVLASRTIRGSKRTQDFLTLVVNHALDGDVDSLRERMIGAELFSRPIGYDTGNDSVVRVRASDARKKLAQYYSAEARNQEFTVRIELPSGSYVPRFHFVDSTLPELNCEPETQESAHHLAVIAQDPSPASELEPVVGNSQGLAKRSEIPIAPRANSTGHRSPRLLFALAAALLMAAFLGVAGYLRWRAARIASTGIHSIAVLPFDNLSGIANQDYFADGITEELINDLGQVSTLRIISFTSSMSFKGTQKTLPEIARKLSVDGVVEGGVLRDGNRVRVTVQLIDARTDRPVWASSYDQDIGSVFSWQGQIAQSIAQEISTRVTPQEQARLQRQRPVDPEAQDLYLHGLVLRNGSNCQGAIANFQKALARSPDYPQAWSGLASCYGLLGESGQMPYEHAFALQKSAAQKAIALDGSLSEAHAELGNTDMTLDRNWPAAAAEFRRALELNPSSATNHEKYAFYLVRTGNPEEAIAQIERSVELDPISGSTFHSEGFIYYFARQYDRALAVTRTVRGLNIALPDWNFLLGATYAAKEMYPAAIRAFQQSGEGPYALGHLGNVYARAGNRAEAQKVIRQLQDDVQRNGVGRYEIALVYIGLGDKDQAFYWLNEAYRAHDVGIVYLKVDPCLDPLRSDPRFTDLLRASGLS